MIEKTPSDFQRVRPVIVHLALEAIAPIRARQYVAQIFRYQHFAFHLDFPKRDYGPFLEARIRDNPTLLRLRLARL
jgi:hypothetical protein